MNFIVILLVLVSIGFSNNSCAMKKEDETSSVICLSKAQKAYDAGQKTLSNLELSLAINYMGEQEYTMFLATKQMKAHYLFCKSIKHSQSILIHEELHQELQQNDIS